MVQGYRKEQTKTDQNMKEQGRDIKQKHSAYVIFGIALALLIIMLTVLALSQKPRCVTIHDTETVSTIERKPQK
jgi:hypothetical protein